jgi:DNA-binding MarR family transcriptional regulator
MTPRNSSAPPRLVYLLNVAHRRVQAFIQRSADGQTAARAGLLMALARDGGTPMAQLGRALDLAGPAISNLVERACRAGLVKRRPDPEDGRAWFIELTAGGLAARKDAVRDARALNDRLCEGFSDEELEVVARWLDAVRTKFPRMDDEAVEEKI